MKIHQKVHEYFHEQFSTKNFSINLKSNQQNHKTETRDANKHQKICYMRNRISLLFALRLKQIKEKQKIFLSIANCRCF